MENSGVSNCLYCTISLLCTVCTHKTGEVEIGDRSVGGGLSLQFFCKNTVANLATNCFTICSVCCSMKVCLLPPPWSWTPLAGPPCWRGGWPAATILASCRPTQSRRASGEKKVSLSNP